MNHPLLLGIEIGGTKLQLGVGCGDGRLVGLERKSIHPTDGAAGILRQIQDGYSALLGRLGVTSEAFAAVGVGYGGPVNPDTGQVIRSYQISGWDGFCLADWLVQNLTIPRAVIQNDADTAGLAEARFGAGRGYNPILYMTIGSGIGGALIIDGRIYRGAGRGAMEIGHLRVPITSEEGCTLQELEHVASGWGIGNAAKSVAQELLREGNSDWVVLQSAGGNPDQITGLITAQAAMREDHLATKILDQAREAVSFALCQAIALLAPRRIILGGGVSLIGEAHWYEPIRNLVKRHVFEPFRDVYDIVPPILGEEVVVHGALALALDALESC